MSHADTLQIIGSFFIALTGATALYVVADKMRWCVYGRWITAVLAASQFVFVASRLVYLAGWMSAENTIVASGMIAATVFSIELNLVVMHHNWHKLGFAEPADHRRNHEQARNV